MKKILFVNASLTSGGSEKVMTLLANEFCMNNYEVSMLLVKPQKSETYFLDPKINKMVIEYKYKNKILRLCERIKKMRKIIKENKYDYIISFMYDINTSTLVASLGLNIPVIISERCDPSKRKLNYFIRKIEDRIYKKASVIVLQTEQVKKQYPKYLQNKFVVIPNPISEGILKPHVGERSHTIVAAGRLTDQKNFGMLIDAFREISKKHSDYKLYIYGEGPLRNELDDRIKKYDLEDKVFMPGYVDNVNELMNDAKIYISTSNYEGISNSMLEALAMGVPTVCTDCPVGGAAMVIKDHVNGILIPINDLDKLVASIYDIIEDKKLEKKLSNNAILLREKLNIKKIYKIWENLLK